MPTKDEICQAIYDCQIDTPKGIKKGFWFDKVILTSGKISVMYVDHRTMCADPNVYNVILAGLIEKAEELRPEFIVSSAEAGNFWGGNVAKHFNIGFAYFSKKGKIAGAIPKGINIIDIDDLNTTLGTLIKVVKGVREYGSEIYNVLVDIDRGEYTPKNVEEFKRLGVKLDALVMGSDLTNYGLNNDLIEPENIEMVEKYKEDEDGCAIDIIFNNQEWFREHDRLEKAKEFYKDNEKVRTAIEEVLA